MPNLAFQVIGVEAPYHAATPLLLFKLHIANVPAGELIHTIILQCQVQIESVKRSYTPAEKEKLRDLFGEPERWGQTLRNKLWVHAQVNVPSFTGEVTVDLPVACTYDMNIAGAKYFYALEQGEIPLLFLFSGTVFHATSDERLQVAQVPWNKEAAFRLPVAVWQTMIEHYYPNTTWLILQRDVFDRLYEYKQRQGLPTWEHVLAQLLPE